jgi:hypothetical protein
VASDSGSGCLLNEPVLCIPTLLSLQITVNVGGGSRQPPAGDEEMAEAGAAVETEEPATQEDSAHKEDTAVGAGAADLSPGNPRLRTEGEGYACTFPAIGTGMCWLYCRHALYSSKQ